jgi:hypothetical protein
MITVRAKKQNILQASQCPDHAERTINLGTIIRHDFAEQSYDTISLILELLIYSHR